MKLLLVWMVAVLGFLVILVLRKLGILDPLDGLAAGFGVVGYWLGLCAATWALVAKPRSGAPVTTE